MHLLKKKYLNQIKSISLKTSGLMSTATTILLTSSCVNEKVSNDLPNIVFIFADDLGYGDLSCYGANGYTTPTIDSLAEHGIKFTNFYAAQAVSSASRAGLLTGCYPNRIGITGALTPMDEHGINSNETTIAEILKQKGYATGIFGKWHLGHHDKFLPLNHGFDEYVGTPYSNDMWPVNYDGTPADNNKSKYPPLSLIEGNKKTQGINTLEDQDKLTTLLTEKATDFIERHKDEPFFLYFPHPMPHVPLGISDKYSGQSEQGKYGDVIMEIDWSVKQIIKTLEKHKLNENTIIVFTSDNGPWLNYGNHAGSTGGLREGKGTSWEGGQRVPCIVNWPGNTPENTVCDKLSSTIDFLPTFAAITGAELPDNKIDGVNILPLLKGDKEATPRKIFLYYYAGNQLEALRKDEWKLVFPHSYRSYKDVEPGNDGWPGRYNKGTCGLELYNIHKDPFEENNIIDQYPEIVKELEAIGDSARIDLGDYLTNTEGKNVREPGYIYEFNINIDNKALNSKILLHTDYHIKYSGNGNNGLIDGKLARPMFKDKSWQGYEGKDVDAKIVFDDLKEVSEVTLSMLKNNSSWIFLPKEIVVEYSTDGETYKPFGSVSQADFTQADVIRKYNGTVNHEPIAVKSIKVVAKNTGTCPDDHPGAGSPAWLFIDEIIVK